MIQLSFKEYKNGSRIFCNYCGHDYGLEFYGEDYDMHQTICKGAKTK